MTVLKRNKTISGQEDFYMAISTVNGSRAVARQALRGGGGGVVYYKFTLFQNNYLKFFSC